MNRLDEHEFELDGELAGLHEDHEFEYEGEAEVARWAGPGAGPGVLGEEEAELHELAGLGQGEEEWEAGAYEGALVGPLGEEEDELHELDLARGGLHEDELDGNPEAFLWRRIKKAVKFAAPHLRQLAARAAPIVGSAVLGPLGGKLGSVVAGALREDELALEGEEELGGEGELEAELGAPISQQEALAELLGEVAAQSRSEAEADAMVGAFTTLAMSRFNRPALRAMLPAMVRGFTALNRLLRRRAGTRVFARAMPLLARSSMRTLARRAASGSPITRRTVAHVLARNTRRLLANPSLSQAALGKNLRAARTAARTSRIRSVRG